jgi:hypothetical protein
LKGRDLNAKSEIPTSEYLPAGRQEFRSPISKGSKTISLTFFKLFERENLNFFSFDQNEMPRKAGFKEIRTLLVLGGILQITLASKTSWQ